MTCRDLVYRGPMIFRGLPRGAGQKSTLRSQQAVGSKPTGGSKSVLAIGPRTRLAEAGRNRVSSPHGPSGSQGVRG